MLAQVVAETGAPNPEVVENAYRSIIEFSVVGAVLVVILAVFIALMWWTLFQGRKREQEHVAAMAAKDEAHQAEREALAAMAREKSQNLNDVLRQKDATIERIQEKRVEMATHAVKAIENVRSRLDTFLDAMTTDEG
jgi:cbb3-type cytochrome oxidase subunit 3